MAGGKAGLPLHYFHFITSSVWRCGAEARFWRRVSGNTGAEARMEAGMRRRRGGGVRRSVLGGAGAEARATRNGGRSGGGDACVACGRGQRKFNIQFIASHDQ